MPPWPWVILGRVPRLAPGDAEAEADAEHAADFSIPVALPPQVTVVAAAPSAHPNPRCPDKYPYILAADASCLLFNFSVKPFYGLNFLPSPQDSNLIVVRQFHHPAAGETTTTAERIPRRDGCHPIIYNIESIGLVSLDGGGDYLIAELMVVKGSERARLVSYRAGDNRWFDKELLYTLYEHDREWVPAGVISHEFKLWWFDLSWGILSCDPFADAHDLELLFHPLPEGRTLDKARPDIHDHRCITESRRELRYVEVIPEGEAATVSMWTGVHAPNGGNQIIAWDMRYEMSFAEIWDDDSYKAIGLPQKVPVLAVVCPSNPDLVYFALEKEQRLFGVDVPVHKVVEFVDMAYELVMPSPPPASSRYVLAWFLPPMVATALGIDPFIDGRRRPPGATEPGDDATEGAS